MNKAERIKTSGLWKGQAIFSAQWMRWISVGCEIKTFPFQPGSWLSTSNIVFVSNNLLKNILSQFSLNHPNIRFYSSSIFSHLKTCFFFLQWKRCASCVIKALQLFLPFCVVRVQGCKISGARANEVSSSYWNCRSHRHLIVPTPNP